MIPALIGSALFGLTMILYILLVFGVPLGEYAMGGKYRVMPLKSRIVTAVTVVIQLFGIVVLLHGGGIIDSGLPGSIVKVACYVYAIYLSLNVLMNIASKSKKEKLFMTPLSFIVAVCFWMVAMGI